jgi:predicted enzyme related to lactoylglutathione lyase
VTTAAPLPARAANVVIDCNDLELVTEFWSVLLGLAETAKEDGWADLGPLGPGGPVLSFQQVPEGKSAKNRLHLDLAVDDVSAAGERAAALGATAASQLHPGGGSPWQVWRDPEGNEFCFVSG